MPTLPSSAAGQRERREHIGAIQKAPRERRGRCVVQGWLAVGGYGGGYLKFKTYKNILTPELFTIDRLSAHV